MHTMITLLPDRLLMRLFMLGSLLILLMQAIASAAPPVNVAAGTRNLILVTLDGLRWQELFRGADGTLINRELGGVRDEPRIRDAYHRTTESAAREALMPFFWNVVAKQGVVYGDPQQESVVRVTNGLYFSYPGYNEILSGRADDRIDSNDKRPNPNITVLEWLHQQRDFTGRVAAFCSWDVFPFIINDKRSGIPVNAGWQPLEVFSDHKLRDELNATLNELPRYWDTGRYDIFTFRGAVEYLRANRPRVLYVAFDETDSWAHDGRYDLYLDAARRTDDYVKRLWDTAQSLPGFACNTSLLITTDHGRGDTRTDWKNHGKDTPGSDLTWIALMGPDVPADSSVQGDSVMQSQVAATAAALLRQDFQKDFPGVAPPLPCITGTHQPAAPNGNDR